jgi:hypothetical protein
MNPDRVYSQYRDDALAMQVMADEYSTFVAMPFRESFSYRSLDVFKEVIIEAARKANERMEAPRKFADPQRIDQVPPVAGVITEDILRGIMASHLFLADLTFENPGVMVELGVALALKPNAQVILVLQGDPASLHFDISHLRVQTYDHSHVDDTLDRIASAFIHGAKSYEKTQNNYVRRVSRTMTPDELQFLKLYAQMQKEYDGPPTGPSLHIEGVRKVFQNVPDHLLRFNLASMELLRKRLFFNDFDPTSDNYGIHATKLGWRVIKLLWREFKDVPERFTEY